MPRPNILCPPVRHTYPDHIRFAQNTSVSLTWSNLPTWQHVIWLRCHGWAAAAFRSGPNQALGSSGSHRSPIPHARTQQTESNARAHAGRSKRQGTGAGRCYLAEGLVGERTAGAAIHRWVSRREPPTLSLCGFG